MTTTAHHSLNVSDVTAVMDPPKLDKVTGLEPYIVFKSGEAKVQTKASKNLEWRDSFVLEKFQPSTTSMLEVEVYDKHTLFPDTNMGTGMIDLATLGPQSLDGKSQRVIVPLINKKNVNTGSVSFYLNGGSYRSGNYQQPSTGTQGTTASGAGRTTGATAASKTQGVKHTGTGATRTGLAGKKVGGSSSSSSSSQEDLSTIETAGRRGTAGTAGATAGAGVGGGVVDRKYYSSHEDRARDEALVEKVKVHKPFVEEYETTVQPTGRERLVGTQVETLGQTERVLNEQERKERTVADVINPRLPAGVVEDRIGGEGWVQGQPGPVVGVQGFEVAGEREVNKERVTTMREHRDVEKEFEIETKLKGERAEPTQAEVVDRHRVRMGDAHVEGAHTETGIGAHTGSGVGGAHTGSGVGGTHTGSGVGGTHTGSGVGGTHTGSGVGGAHTGSGVGGAHTGSQTGGAYTGTQGNRDAEATRTGATSGEHTAYPSSTHHQRGGGYSS